MRYSWFSPFRETEIPDFIEHPQQRSLTPGTKTRSGVSSSLIASSIRISLPSTLTDVFIGCIESVQNRSFLAMVSEWPRV